MKGTEFKKLMWLYADEAMIRKRRYVRGGKKTADRNRKMHKPYRCEKVMNRLLRIDSDAFVKRLNRKEASNAGELIQPKEKLTYQPNLVKIQQILLLNLLKPWQKNYISLRKNTGIQTNGWLIAGGWIVRINSCDTYRKAILLMWLIIARLCFITAGQLCSHQCQRVNDERTQIKTRSYSNLARTNFTS
ncbi:hypothetical protein ACJ0V8_009095 [Proteus mirabilis]|uniref:hypothetical protein n=1 Tax=Proteus mirabilis TaxID=584 RepID=UPI003EE69DC3